MRDHTEVHGSALERRDCMTKWLALDAFGTLLEITNPVRPFFELKKSMAWHAKVVAPDFSVQAMTQRHDLGSLAAHYGYQPTPKELAQWSAWLEKELDSIRTFPDAEPVVEQALQAGWGVVVCSNLAAPYTGAVDAFLAPFRARYGEARVTTAYSCDVGFLKPDTAFFKAVEQQLECPAEGMVMMGDRKLEDVEGPQSCGWKAFHVDRVQGLGLLEGWAVLSKASQYG